MLRFKELCFSGTISVLFPESSRTELLLYLQIECRRGKPDGLVESIRCCFNTFSFKTASHPCVQYDLE